jgi:hypothetical protein
MQQQQLVDPHSPHLRLVHYSKAAASHKHSEPTAPAGQVWYSSSGHMCSWGLGDGCDQKVVNALSDPGAAGHSTRFAALDWSLSRKHLAAVVHWDTPKGAQEQAAELLVCALLWHTQGRNDLVAAAVHGTAAGGTLTLSRARGCGSSGRGGSSST